MSLSRCQVRGLNHIFDVVGWLFEYESVDRVVAHPLQLYEVRDDR